MKTFRIDGRHRVTIPKDMVSPDVIGFKISRIGATLVLVEVMEVIRTVEKPVEGQTQNSK